MKERCLYHFSEEPDIRTFRPRPSAVLPDRPPVVFAIDEEHAAHYYFPRDCPRVIYWKSPGTTEADMRELFAHTAADKVIAVESRWLDRIRNVKLYRYTFPASSFTMTDGTAGYYVSEQEIEPVAVEPVTDLIGKLLDDPRLELRFMPNLYPLRNRVIASTADFSIIRFRNAIDRL